MKCWRCGENLASLTLPLGRLDECRACNAQLHVCRQCVHFDAAVTKACREDDAEEIKEKERANFCDYFIPAEDAFDAARAGAEQQAKSDLASLFGDTDAEADSLADRDAAAARAAEDLFGKKD